MPIEDFARVLACAQAGEEWAVRCLYGELQPPLLRYLGWQAAGAGEDLASETWFAVAERIGDFEGDERQFRAWIFAIARRRLVDHRRQSARRRTVPWPVGDLAAIGGAQDPADLVLERVSAEEAIARITAPLPSDQAEVLMLRVVGGLSVEQTAQVVGKRPGHVRVLQHRALRKLAGELGRLPAMEV